MTEAAYVRTRSEVGCLFVVLLFGAGRGRLAERGLLALPTPAAMDGRFTRRLSRDGASLIGSVAELGPQALPRWMGVSPGAHRGTERGLSAGSMGRRLRGDCA